MKNLSMLLAEHCTGICNPTEVNEDAFYETLERGAIEYDWQKRLYQLVAQIFEEQKDQEN